MENNDLKILLFIHKEHNYYEFPHIKLEMYWFRK